MPRRERLNILVEGPTDQRFVERVLSPFLRTQYFPITIAQYATTPPGVIDDLIGSFRRQSEAYILMADNDHYSCIVRRVADLIRKYPSAEPTRVQIIVQEIEGWYLAGVGLSACAKLHLDHHRLSRGTDELVKEDVGTVRKPTCTMNVGELLVAACGTYDWKLARRRNASLDRFARTFMPWVTARTRVAL